MLERGFEFKKKKGIVVVILKLTQHISLFKLTQYTVSIKYK